MTRKASVYERDTQAAAISTAKQFGWLVHHDKPAVGHRGQWATHTQGHPGFPDVVFCRPPQLLIVEFKRKGEKPRANQQAWLDALEHSGVTVRVDDEASLDELLTILSRRAA